MYTYSICIHIYICIHSPTAQQNCSWHTLSGTKEKRDCGGYAVPVSAGSWHAIYSWRLLIGGGSLRLGGETITLSQFLLLIFIRQISKDFSCKWQERGINISLPISSHNQKHVFAMFPNLPASGNPDCF